MINILQQIRAQIAQWLGKERTGGFTKVIDVPVTVQATPDYSDGDVIGTLLAIDVKRNAQSVQSGVIKSIHLVNAATTSSIEILFFNELVTLAADNAAFAPSQADLEKVLPSSYLNFVTYDTINSLNFSSLDDLFIPYETSTGSIYAVLIADAAINFTAAANLHLRVSILQD